MRLHSLGTQNKTAAQHMAAMNRASTLPFTPAMAWSLIYTDHLLSLQPSLVFSQSMHEAQTS